MVSTAVCAHPRGPRVCDALARARARLSVDRVILTNRMARFTHADAPSCLRIPRKSCQIVCEPEPRNLKPAELSNSTLGTRGVVSLPSLSQSPQGTRPRPAHAISHLAAHRVRSGERPHPAAQAISHLSSRPSRSRQFTSKPPNISTHSSPPPA